MIRVYLLLFIAGLSITTQAQSVQELQQTANTFMRQGDYANSILVLNRATALEPQNVSVMKDLAQAYYYNKQNDKALEFIKKVLDSEEADDQSFQIAGNIYKDLVQPKDADKVYRKGLKRFPNSGPLYSELGELLMAQQDFSSIKQWEKGIEMDPSYSRNYFNASKYYYLSNSPVWAMIYGEIFANMEPFGKRTAEIKSVILDSYKKVFTNSDLTQNLKDKKEFEKLYLQDLAKQVPITTFGINTETLTMIRTRFILDWYANAEAAKMPFKLFELHQELLQTGLFEAYNQWLFGSVENLAAYQNWTNLHVTETKALQDLQKNRMFKIPTGQYFK